jgi:hypothetical protein
LPRSPCRPRPAQAAGAEVASLRAELAAGTLDRPAGVDRGELHGSRAGSADPGICPQLGRAPALCQAGPRWHGPSGLGSPHCLGWF